MLQRLSVSLYLVTALLSGTPGTGWCQVPEMPNIEVSVVDPVGAGLQGATVNIQLPDQTLSQFALTDNGGEYRTYMPAGTYNVEVLAPGRGSSGRQVTVPPSGSSAVRFTFRPPEHIQPPDGGPGGFYGLSTVFCPPDTQQCDIRGVAAFIHEFSEVTDRLVKTNERLSEDVAAWFEGGTTALIETEVDAEARNLLEKVEVRLLESLAVQIKQFIAATVDGSPPSGWSPPFQPFGFDSPELVQAKTRAAREDNRWVMQLEHQAVAEAHSNQLLQRVQVQRPGQPSSAGFRLACSGSACGQLVHASVDGFASVLREPR